MARLLAAMSGGVDSAVAAAFAVREGHDVTAVTLKQWDDPDEVVRLTKGCSVADAVDDARRVANQLRIPHYTLDFREAFAREVIDPFVHAYANGTTPNPCVRCNERVRFGALVDKARALGFEGLVTGHYARTSAGRLFRALNRSKDQSYVLYAVIRDALSFARFPLGEFTSKDEVRATASSLGLPNAGREDSVEVCFVPEGFAPGDVVGRRVPVAVRRGPVVDDDGKVVGEHKGLAYYTIGQRKGLGSLGRRRYVTRIDASRNAVIVGDAEGLSARGLVATRTRFVSGLPPRDGARIHAVVRYQGAENAATFEAITDGFRLEFDEPVRAVAPGQSVVLYSGDEVLGGGTIAAAS